MLKSRLRRIDRVLLGAILSLLAIGVIMTYSSSAVKGYLYYDDPYHFFKAELLWVTLGLTVMAFALAVDWKLLYNWAKPILYVALFLLILVKVPGIGRNVNGAVRWIGLGPLSIQPSEVIKLAMILIVARLLSAHPHQIGRFKNGIMPVLLLLGLVCLLIMLQPDLGTTLVIAAATFFMLIAAGARAGHIAALGSAGLLMVVAAIAAAPYRMRRIFAFIDPWADPSGKGYQTIQSLLALGPGGLFGLGLGQSRQKFLYLPENHTDFIFAMIGEELGFIGATIVVGLFFIVVWRGFRTAMYAPNPFLALMAVGLTSLIGIQAMINMGVVSGILPVTGITLPFLSYGGTSLVFTMLGAGLLLNISSICKES
ncbi:cell division-specific peptidoglycan biosynthesis regulator FtsW [Syntrophobotulus glycolicus DSM 8271]|uniref:Probable peptidoglycan glycosyltransferase FtsW n=1 Tax=Syntrophobotulus glycolicus (strain DSM 8271 / FlGlyR) TaxID=645991 RepID=F0SZZ8_SYNGF|nr:putative lipid II flippase FtsW [Syntrophobotulus glycolicus]ADY55009.1 cell division-specific peptidoglycan biosynthesis regulator FtsW [Syntrophobotulus glycolicus DSM 8271]